jgi:YD repeat-containing protein
VARVIYRYHQWSGQVSGSFSTPAGGSVGFGSSAVLGFPRDTGRNQPAGAGCGPASSSITYDVNANVASRTDFNGAKTCYVHDLSRNLETRRVEGLPATADCAAALSAPPSGSRVISQRWHSDWRLETGIAEPKKLTTIVYNGQGATCAPSTVLVDGKPPAVICSRTEQATADETGAAGFSAAPVGAARTWSYTYTTYGRVLTATDPNGNTTSTSYHPDTDANLGRRGQIATVTNPAGHVTSTTDYNAHSQPTRIVDPNGLVTQLTYDLRQRPTSRTVGNETTTFAYDPAGQLIRVTLPDGAQVNYTYDAAHRLTGVTDNRGNKVVYTLDAMGNRVNEQVAGADGALVRNIQRAVDALNRVSQVTGRE